MRLPLVRHVRHRIFPGGGPFGYLDSLRQSLALAAPPEGVRIVVEERPELVAPSAEPTPGAIARLLARAAYKCRRAFRSELELRLRAQLAEDRAAFSTVGPAQAAELLSCDLLFVHDILLAERLVRVAAPEARSKVVLLTHAPSFYAEQWVATLAPDRDLEASRRLPVVREEIDRELELMRSVRAVAWPFPEARDGYPEWLRVGDPPLLVPSGVPRPTARESRGETRGRWGATDADSVLLFMGRPHPHKGFDRFAAWSRHARGAGSRLMFVSAGSEASWPGLDLSGIVAVGYQADPAAAYLAADLVLFPNRKAYLDFGLLQCLSLGVPVAVSPVGGHAALVRECTPIPVIPPGDGDEVVPWLEKTASAGLPPDYRERVVRLWEERFSPLPFVLGHADAARRLLGV